MKRGTYLLSVFLVLFAGSVAADGWQWHDQLYNKSWVLTPSADEVLVVFARGTNQNSRAAIASAERLSERHSYSALTGVAVYRVPTGEVAQQVAGRLSHQPNVLQATPAVIDQDGFMRYYVPGRLVIQLQESLSDAECRAIIRGKGSRILIDYWTPGFYDISTPPGRDVFRAIRNWYEDPSLVFAEPTWIEYDSWDFIPNDPQFTTHQWNLQSTSAKVVSRFLWKLPSGRLRRGGTQTPPRFEIARPRASLRVDLGGRSVDRHAAWFKTSSIA